MASFAQMSVLRRAPSLFVPALLTLALSAGLVACDKPAEEPAEKVDEKSEQDKLVEERLAKKKAEREAKKKAEEEAEAAKQKELDEICVLPDAKEMPKDIDKACKAVAQANDDFMNRLYEGDALTRWNEAKGTQLPMTEGQCKKTGSVEVAACQINGMNEASPELRKALPDILRACIEKFGPGAAGAEGGEAAGG